MSTQTASSKEFSYYDFLPVVASPAKSSFQHLDESINRLREGARQFAKLSIDERLQLAYSMQKGYLNVAERSVKAACKAKGIGIGTLLEGEEWATGPLCVVRHLRLVRESLQSIKQTGNTTIGKVGRTITDKLAVQVYPVSTIDGILFKDVRVDVHMQSGMTEEKLESSRASFYKQPDHEGKVVMVLGAGNIAAIPSMDVISKMFNEGKVCILKMNPINAYIGPFIEEAFAEAIKRNFLVVVYGGVEEGEYLTRHEQIDEIHITGSDKTHDAIVWGPPGPERAERMARNNPVINKTISSELGNVSPVIIVSGPYTDKELRFQAEDLAGSFGCNASFLCCAPVMIVTYKGWEQRDKFLGYLEEQLASLETKKAYYPGARERWKTITDSHSNVSTFGSVTTDSTPWTLIRGLDPNNVDEPLFNNEPFCSVLAETVIDAGDPVNFLERAVEFVNKRLWGTLTANIIVHPRTMKDSRLSEAVERMISDLHYGTVTVNSNFHGFSFSVSTPPWGAYPGSALNDIQSGRGWVHNTNMLEGIEKTVARFPLTAFPKPAWFPSHRTADKLIQRMVTLEEHASWSKVPGVVLTAMRG
ncbi:MAG: aldehyde dehydrogenase [Gammaproteobacteria bacterium]